MVEDRVPRRDLSTAVRANCVFHTRGDKGAAGRPIRRRTLGGTYRVKTHTPSLRVQELCDNRGGRPGFPSLISLMVSVDVKQH